MSDSHPDTESHFLVNIVILDLLRPSRSGEASSGKLSGKLF